MKQTKLKDFIGNLIIILLIILGLIFGIGFVYGVIKEKANFKECESEGLDLIHPPLSGFKWYKEYYCGNVSELNKTHDIKQALISGWWFWDKNETN